MKASVNIAISLDGFIARPDGDVSWLDAYNEDCGFDDFFSSIDCLVMGRKSFEKVLSFDVDWPYGEKPVVILSHSNVQIPNTIEHTVELMGGSPIEVMDALKRRGFNHLYIDGGFTIRGFLHAGLINSLLLTRVPILLGSGISLFDGLVKEVELNHIVTKSFDSGLVQSEYRIENT